MFNKEECLQVVKQIEAWQEKFLDKYGVRFVYASDEWYLSAGLEVPKDNEYEGYMQLENGVGMVRLLQDEVTKTLEELDGDDRERVLSLATGKLASGVIKKQVDKIQDKYPNIKINVHTIINDFFGHDITVAGFLLAVI
jgi:NifB/MoaA-like Fe-S oxidoreductase